MENEQYEDKFEINQITGEIILPCSNDISKDVQEVKIKAAKLLTKNDFVQINGVWEAKRDGLIKILSSLPISYSWKIKEQELSDTYAKVLGVLEVQLAGIIRSSDCIGVCEANELKGVKSLHFLVTRAETRALKRGIEVLFGSVINWYVVRYLS